MSRKLPAEAFEFDVGLGPQRAYTAVAKEFGCSKVAVVNMAKRENWQGRLQAIEQKARAESDKKAAETYEEIRERHLRAARIMQAKAIEKLKGSSLDTAMDAVRALEMGVRTERLLLGEPTDRSAVSVEELIKREYQTLLVTAEQAEESWNRYEVEQAAREAAMASEKVLEEEDED